MMAPKLAPFGTWESPIQPRDFAAGSTRLEQVCVNKSNGKIYLLEMRPGEDGRGAIIEYSAGNARDVLPAAYSALSQVHEYGGASFAVRDDDGHLIFTDIASKLIFDLDPETGHAQPIVPEDPKVYFADFDIDPQNPKWVIAIREDHHADRIEDIKTSLVAIDCSTKTVSTLVDGSDFYTFPRFNPVKSQISWIQWNHPNMPWDHTELWIADWKSGQVSNAQPVAGHTAKASVTQPVWGLDGTLFFVDDRTGWWQLYRYKDGEATHIPLQGLEEAEFGYPDWWLGSQSLAPLSESKLVAFYNKDGRSTAIEIDLNTSKWTDINCPINEVNFNAVKAISANTFAVIGATPTKAQSFFLVDVRHAADMKELRSSTKLHLDEAFVSQAQNIKFERIHGPGGGEAHALFFEPRNPNFKAPEGTRSPLIVAMHGGPTWCQGPGLYLRDHFLLTRGYSLVQINYVGSSGYGTKYRNLLKGQWGVSDIADAVSCVEFLAKKGLIDKNRVGLTGHSAGGYATMQAAVVYPDLWACAIPESGISGLQALLDETHKMESRYLQPLMWRPGTSQADAAKIIRERSPIFHAANIKTPMLILGGSIDPICPPSQNTTLAKEIKKTGAQVEVHIYEGEGHIFSKGSTLEDMEVRREAWFRKYLVDVDK